MLRTLAMANDKSPSAKLDLPHLESVSRFSKLPVVETAWNYATDVYGKVKVMNPMIKWTLSTAESAVNMTVGQALPVASRLEKPLNLVDTILCKGLDIVEDRVPLVKLPPQEIIETTKKYIDSTVRSALQRANSVKDFSTDTVRGISIDSASNAISKCGTIAVSGVESVMDMADEYMDHYLPPTEEEKVIENGPVSVPDNKALHLLKRAERLSSKFHTRSARATSNSLVRLKKRRDDAVELVKDGVNISLDLSRRAIDGTRDMYVRGELDLKTVVGKLSTLWEDLNLEDEKVTRYHPNDRSIVVAKNLGRRIVRGIKNTRDIIVSIPGFVRKKTTDTIKFAEETANSFIKAANLEPTVKVLSEQVRAGVEVVKKPVARGLNFFLTHGIVVESLKRVDHVYILVKNFVDREMDKKSTDNGNLVAVD